MQFAFELDSWIVRPRLRAECVDDEIALVPEPILLDDAVETIGVVQLREDIESLEWLANNCEVSDVFCKRQPWLKTEIQLGSTKNL